PRLGQLADAVEVQPQRAEHRPGRPPLGVEQGRPRHPHALPPAGDQFQALHHLGDHLVADLQQPQRLLPRRRLRLAGLRPTAQPPVLGARHSSVTSKSVRGAKWWICPDGPKPGTVTSFPPWRTWLTSGPPPKSPQL